MKPLLAFSKLVLSILRGHQLSHDKKTEKSQQNIFQNDLTSELAIIELEFIFTDG